MGTGLLSIGVSGIKAAQLALLATEHNVVNASTPGYTRQSTVQATNFAVNTGAGAIGQGVHVQTIRRSYDQYLTGQVNTATSRVSEIYAYSAQISQIDNMLADPSAGLTPALQDFFSGVQQVAANPSLLSARQSMISSAQTLVGRFQVIDNRLSELTDQVNGKIRDAVTAVNSYATQIADLNQRIVISESSYGQPANDLLDQRDQLINDLNKLIGVKTSSNSDGSFNVFVGSGQQLVVGSRAMTMTATASVADTSRIVVGLQTAAGGTLEMPEKLIAGGELGGLIKFRSETLDRVQNELGRVAASLALTFNAQHALGQDLIGQANGDTSFVGEFFTLTNGQPTIVANTRNTAGAFFSASFLPPSFGPEAATGNFYTDLPTSDYQLVNLDGTNYSLTRLSDGVSLMPPGGGDLTAVNTALANVGISMVLTGDSQGNSYLIQPTRSAAGNIAVNPVIAADSRLIAAAAPFRTAASSSNTGTATISAGRMVGGTPAGFDLSAPPGPLPVSFEYNAAASTLSVSGAGAPSGIRVKLPGQAETQIDPIPPAATVASIPYVQGMVISFNGMSVEFTGVPDEGDVFTLEGNSAGTADGRNALAFGQLQTKNTVAGSTATLQSAYAEMVANNGIKTRELQVVGEAQDAVLAQAQANRDALSGVNLDEEAANLLRFQQAYQASAKLLEVGKTLFDTLLQIG